LVHHMHAHLKNRRIYIHTKTRRDIHTIYLPRTKIETNLNKVKRPPFVNDLRVASLSLGNGVPIIEVRCAVHTCPPVILARHCVFGHSLQMCTLLLQSLEKVYTRQDGIFFECMVCYCCSIFSIGDVLGHWDVCGAASSNLGG
jgi:hypothetical protein